MIRTLLGPHGWPCDAYFDAVAAASSNSGVWWWHREEPWHVYFRLALVAYDHFAGDGWSWVPYRIETRGELTRRFGIPHLASPPVVAAAVRELIDGDADG